jgi:hypothetical protein
VVQRERGQRLDMLRFQRQEVDVVGQTRLMGDNHRSFAGSSMAAFAVALSFVSSAWNHKRA